MVIGFFLTLSYKSVLRAMMMNVSYEKTIDTTDDMLASERTLMLAGDSVLPLFLESDPRAKATELAKGAVQTYNYGTGSEDELRHLHEG